MIRAFTKNMLVAALAVRELLRSGRDGQPRIPAPVRPHDGEPLDHYEARQLAEIAAGLLADFREGP